MCSFIFRRYKKEEKKRKISLTDSDLQRHIDRGPDSAFSIYTECKNWKYELSHFLLALSGTPEKSLQPITEGEYFLLFNGQIYNTDEVANLCEIDDVQNSIDTQLLLKLLITKGADALKYVFGSYAFVFGNFNTGKIIFGSDPQGLKQIYFNDESDEINISTIVPENYSENEILISLGDLYSRNVKDLFGFYPSGENIRNFTIGIPGVIYEIYTNSSKISTRSTFVANETNEVPVIRFTSPRRLIDDLRSIILQHINITDLYETGMLVSAGFDSQLLLNTLSDNVNIKKRIKLFSLRYLCGSIVSEWADTVKFTQALGYDALIPIDIDDETLIRYDFDLQRKRFINSSDGLNLYACLSEIRILAPSVRVVLTGTGGDELTGGYPSENLAFGLNIIRPERLYKIVKYLHYRKIIWLVAFMSRTLQYFLIRASFFDNNKFEKFINEITLKNSEIDKMETRELESYWYLKNQLLRDSNIIGGMLSIDVRAPLADRRVVELFKRASEKLGGMSRKKFNQYIYHFKYQKNKASFTVAKNK